MHDTFAKFRCLVASSDVLAGYAIMAVALPTPGNIVPVILLSIAAGIIVGASSILSDTFAPTHSPKSNPKGMLYLGSALATLGMIIAMASSFYTGVVPVYLAAVLLLLTWTRLNNVTTRALAHSINAGVRVVAFLLGASAHKSSLYLNDSRLFILAAAYLVIGFALATLRESEAEGGKRWMLSIAFAPIIGALLWVGFWAGEETFGQNSQLPLKISPSSVISLVGLVILLKGALSAINTISPIELRRAARLALLSTMFLNTALIFSRWQKEPSVIALGVVSAVLIIPALAMSSRKDKRPAIISYKPTELT